MKQLHDYYQIDPSTKENERKGEIISILSMEIAESDGLSHSYSHQEEFKNDPYKMDSKNSLK